MQAMHDVGVGERGGCLAARASQLTSLLAL